MKENIEQQSTSKKILDLSDGWKRVDSTDSYAIPSIINSKDEGKYWRFTKDGNFIITMEGKIRTQHERSKTIIKLIDFSQTDIQEATKKRLLDNLGTFDLDGDNFAIDATDACEKAKETGKNIFWFISKGKDERSVVILDFSSDKNHPKRRSSYPLDVYKPKKLKKI